MDVKNDTDSDDIDPISDITEYLVRCAKVSFKNAHMDEKELRTADKIKLACDLFKQSPIEFLQQFGKYLAPSHINYFETLSNNIIDNSDRYRECIKQLKVYHSSESRRKRIRNRRYKALQKFKVETDYFSDKQMMFRNPLLYEQLVGQYLTDEEIKERDGVDSENLTFLSMILDTVDRNEFREKRNEQILEEDLASTSSNTTQGNHIGNSTKSGCSKRWGEFEIPDTTPNYKPEPRTQSLISAPERRLLQQEFIQEMYSSFVDGRDVDIDYDDIDNDEQYDDIEQVSQDAEDRYFDSEQNDAEHLETHMRLVDEYGRRKSNDSSNDDPLEVFMHHLNKQCKSYLRVLFLTK